MFECVPKSKGIIGFVSTIFSNPVRIIANVVPIAEPTSIALLVIPF